jgi:hypothetical protein
MTTYGQDTFQRANTANGTWGTATDGQAWSHIAGSATTFAVTSNEGVISNTPFEWDRFALGTNYSITGDQEISVRVIVDSATSGFGVTPRTNNTSSAGYFVMYDGTNGLVIYRNDGGLTSLNSSAFTVTVGNAYWIKSKISGSTIQAKMWLDGTSEPAYSLSATDATYSSGGIGIVGRADGGNLQFDHFLATDGVTSVTTQKTVSSRLRLFAVAQKAIASRFNFFTGAQKTFSTRLFFGQIAVQRVMTRVRLFATAQQTFASRFKQDGFLSQKSIAARLFHYAIAAKAYRGRLRLFDVARRAYRTRFFLFSLARETFVTRFSLYVPDLNAQMTFDDARQQYAIIKASSTAARIAVIGIVLYPPATVINEHVVPAEIDVLLKGEDWSQLHELRTIGQVNDFLARFP